MALLLEFSAGTSLIKVTNRIAGKTFLFKPKENVGSFERQLLFGGLEIVCLQFLKVAR